jgi:hypothetical protein
MDKDRKLIFISHANPEDNEFTLWLASRLSAQGYLVWSDLTKLFGAEVFWDDIEDAIRNHAAKVIVVLSRIAQEKDGVLDEINLAVSVERKQRLERFVVPVRIDDLPFSDVKPNLARKNIIDFKNNWAEGFGKLSKVLARDNVAREYTRSAQEISSWVASILAGSRKVVKEPQSLLSNRFRVSELPQTVNFLSVPLPHDQLWARFESFAYPVFPYQGMLATFASLEDVNRFLPSWLIATTAYRIPLAAILHGKLHRLPQLGWAEASNMLSFLIRTAWDRAMREKGLQPYEMANGRITWFLVNEYSPGNWTKYPDMDGVERRRRLVGRSDKRAIYWHFAMEAWPLISQEPRIALSPHVIFTKDGTTPLSNDKRMHRVRRGFCKNWWNPRWRDLMLAYTFLISDTTRSITLPVGSDQVLGVDSRPVCFETPVSVGGRSKPSYIEDESDSQLDALAENGEWDTDDETDDETGDEELGEPEDRGSP